jgi:hypothetical protein
MNLRALVLLVAGSVAVTSAKAGEYILGMDFVVNHPTTIDELGAYDGGKPFTFDESVGIFSASTGNLVGPDVVFGPGSIGTQIGKSFYETVTPFVLSPGEYSIIEVSDTPITGGGIGSDLSDTGIYGDLGGALDLPGGGRFNSGTGFTVGSTPGGNSGKGNGDYFDSLIGGFVIVDPPSVPDGGTTLTLLGASLAGLSLLRRKF